MKKLIILALLSMTSCAHVPINDHEWCGDEGSLGATCFHFLTAQTRDLDKETWDNMRFGQICTNDPEGQLGATFADIKATIEKLCSISKGACVYPPTSTSIRAFFQRVEEFQAAQRAMRR